MIMHPCPHAKLVHLHGLLYNESLAAVAAGRSPRRRRAPRACSRRRRSGTQHAPPLRRLRSKQRWLGRSRRQALPGQTRRGRALGQGPARRPRPGGRAQRRTRHRRWARTTRAQATAGRWRAWRRAGRRWKAVCACRSTCCWRARCCCRRWVRAWRVPEQCASVGRPSTCSTVCHSAPLFRSPMCA